MADEIKLRKQSENSVTYIPNYFIDECMSSANGEFVKIYLYLLRCMGSESPSLSLTRIADKFEHTEKDVKRALKYWEKMNILHLEYDENKKLSGISLLDLKKSKEVQPRQSTQETLSKPENKNSEIETVVLNTMKTDTSDPVKNGTASKKPSYSLEQLKAFQSNTEIKQLLFISEKYLGKVLSSTELSTILYFYDSLKFSVDLIEYLIEYCVCKGHRSIHYIEKVALSWAQSQIQSVAEAKKATSTYNQTYYSVLKAFGISGRNLVEPEIQYIQKWSKEYGFSIDIILEACKRTMQKIHTPSFEYTDSILKRWNTKGVKTLNDLIPLDEQHHKLKASASKTRTKTVDSNKFNNFHQRSYDYEQLEKQLLNVTP
ncbi:DnaD domain protein [Anaerosacchariphilus polymeriproducens]|uniref:DnaD domain protein n=1 Tax=Anaerosacchariphilus polymeriproducens TaxID=1812858 RepID=A0A371AZS5_9FIRM|nr:DnaD domain protein [Anaerosacchariphilus polymeriproducens]RDU25104.1 DnaD domain protein [Anaerosacchariphilus polymeriproducens]